MLLAKVGPWELDFKVRISQGPTFKVRISQGPTLIPEDLRISQGPTLIPETLIPDLELVEEPWSVHKNHTYDYKYTNHCPDNFYYFLIFFLKKHGLYMIL